MPMAYDLAPRTIQAGSSSSSGLDAHFDFLPPPLSPSDADSVPRTPDGLIPADLPPDPKQAVFALAQQHHQHAQHLKNVNIKARPIKHEHSPAPPAPPTISTFSASNLNHIHIVQEYVHGGSSGAGKQNKQPGGGSTPLGGPGGGVANPFCTNSLHNFMPTMGGGHANALAPGQPPRPANAWILYRSDKMKDLKPTDPAQPRPAQADISKLIAAMWKNEQPEVRQRYEALSDMKKAEHLALYPGYRFQPMKKADREKFRAEKKAEKDRERAAVAMAKSVRKVRKRGEGEDAPNPITFVSTPGPTAMETGTPAPPPTSYGPRPGSAAGVPSVTTPTARTHNFAYSPYAVPSLDSSAPRIKRGRKHTKTESAPALHSESATVQDSEFAQMSAQHLQMHPPVWEQGEGAPLLDFTGYNSPSQPQLSSGSSSDINSHPTPPYSTLDPTMANGGGNPTPPTNEHAFAATLESIGGENDMFQFTNFDASSLLAGADIDITLPSDFSLDFMEGVGLGFSEFNMFEAQGQQHGTNGGVDPLSGGFNGQGGMALGPFADIEGLNGLNAHPNGQDGATNHNGMMFNNSTGQEYGQGFDYASSGALHMSDPSAMQQRPQQHSLSISTQLMQQHTGPLSAMSDFTSPIEPPPSASSFYSTFSSTSSHAPYAFHNYTSPPNTHTYTSPPPLAQIDEEPMTAHPQSLQAARGTRRADNTWR